MKTWVLITVLVASAFCQQPPHTPTTKAGKTKVPDVGNPVPSGTQPANQPPLGSRLLDTVASSTSDPDDHVSCFFSVKQLMALRPIPGVVKLTESDQSRVLTAVVKTVDQTSDKELKLKDKADFMKKLAGELNGSLLGKTPGEALATIMNLLYEIQINSENDRVYASARNKDELRRMAVEKAGGGADILGKAVQNKLDTTAGWFKPDDPGLTLGNVASLIRQIPEADVRAASPTLSLSSAPNLSARIAETADALESAKTATTASAQLSGAVVDSARNELNKLARPDDIQCAYQILSWKDARLMFGRSVANEFIAVQVTVRNLNLKEEFMVHNAMLSVDTDINGAVGQYSEGVDKIGVEAYNNAGESLTARGIVGNSISAATTLLSTLQPIVGLTNFSNAVAAFNGGVPKGWAALEPDHQKEQLLMIANNGFSATGNFKTMVPKSSAATFFTWFPAKPFLEGWWVQECAQNMMSPKPVTPKPDPAGVAPAPQLGVAKERARSEVCKGLTGTDLKTVPYQKWSSISDQLFRDLSLAVVAGIHVREDSKNHASITDLKCPKDAQGQLNLSKPSSGGTISCDVTGENLDKVTKLRLENAGNLVDPARPEGVVSEVSSDNASAKVTFNVSELLALSGDSYNVFAVGKDGTETATGQKIYRDKTKKQDATLTKVEPASLDLGKQPLDKITLTGTSLDKLKNVGLSTGSGTDCKKVPIDATATQATLDVSSAGLTQSKWTIYFEDCTEPNNSKQTLIVTGIAPSKPAPDKAKGGPKAPPKKPGATPPAQN